VRGERGQATVEWTGVLLLVALAPGALAAVALDGRLYDVFTLRDGKIVRMDQFTEQSEALEAVGLRD
jgi:ketosteroid isomerase-like protein